MNDYGAYQFLAVFLVVAVLLRAGAARVGPPVGKRKFSPQKPGARKKTRFTSVGWMRAARRRFDFKSEYNIYAIIFLIFDVESFVSSCRSPSRF
jgi:NADH:ubiquinone oxidoreductase subunit 3 (subunit A)